MADPTTVAVEDEELWACAETRKEETLVHEKTYSSARPWVLVSWGLFS